MKLQPQKSWHTLNTLPALPYARFFLIWIEIEDDQLLPHLDATYVMLG